MVDQNPELEEWRVDLAGTDFDLGHLAESLTKPTAQVKRREEGNGYYLISDTFADLDDAGEVRAKAAVLLGQINGAARIESSVFENVTLGSAVVRVGGKKRSITVFTESGRARARMGPVKLFISNPNGSIQELGGCPTLAERALELGRTDEAVAKALRLFEQPNWTKRFLLPEKLRITKSEPGGLRNLPNARPHENHGEFRMITNNSALSYVVDIEEVPSHLALFTIKFRYGCETCVQPEKDQKLQVRIRLPTESE